MTRHFEPNFLLFLALLCGALSSVSLAQVDPVAGFPPFSTQAAGPYDSIDLASSNITLTLPVRDKAGKVESSFRFITNSHLWFFYSPAQMNLEIDTPSFNFPVSNVGFFGLS